MILGDNNGSPECRRVVFALPREGRPLVIGGKYSEVIFAWAVAEAQVVVGGVETERCAEDGEEKRAGLYTPKKEMNQIFEHGLVIPCTQNSIRREVGQVQPQESNPMDIASLSQVRSSVPLSPRQPPINFPAQSAAPNPPVSPSHTPTSPRDHNVDYRISAQAMSHSRISLRQQTHRLQSSGGYHHPSWFA
jgi:hypothetical protein